ncbi:spore germination protein [Ferviditalea candida]|uniref:Spore germination protein n=1 Tax=Ferviditalea candida TaxID=3108399 RepID=A0ABU5ZJA0_9BACL|nr:spore germination protein [Paenibacillaceae bacterium T2]
MVYKNKFKRAKQLRPATNHIEDIPDRALKDSIDANQHELESILSKCADLKMRKIKIFGAASCLLAYFEEMVDGKHLDNALLRTLMVPRPIESVSAAQIAETLQEEFVSIAATKVIETLQEAVLHILKGDTLLFLEGSAQSLAVSIKNPKDRGLEEPNTESLIRGPRVGFIENPQTNMSLIRQRIRSPLLKMEKFTVGSMTKTEVIISYLEKTAPEAIVREVKDRISKIEMESVLESGYIEEMIRDARYSPFPIMQMTERPDSVAASLIEGKVAIMIQGTPMVLIVPMTFWSAFQTVEDFYTNYIFSSVLRWLRYLFAFIALVLPAFYIAVSTYHQEMIPTSLALSIASSRELVPFPTWMEMFIMEITFEALREAGIRLPRPVGQTVSIVGALVIGEAAVQAGIISAPIVIIVSMTGIASFLIPNTNMSLTFRLLRFPMMFFSGMLGLYGLGASLIAMLIHMGNLRSFGVPYLTPVAPFDPSGLRDVLVRAPWWTMRARPNYNLGSNALNESKTNGSGAVSESDNAGGMSAKPEQGDIMK